MKDICVPFISKKSKAHHLAPFNLLLIVIFVFCSAAQAARFLIYEYDNAGNLVSIEPDVAEQTPQVTAIQPPVIYRQRLVFATATGSFLRDAIVTTTTPGLTIANIDNTLDNVIAFSLYADNTAELGPAILIFTAFGSTNQSILIADEPGISTRPNPIILAPNNQAVTVKLLFDKAYGVEQNLTLAMQDPALASLQETALTLPPGEIELTMTLTGHNVGLTYLHITQAPDIAAVSLPVIITDQQLPTGTIIASAVPVGVATQQAQSIDTSGTFTSLPVGVATQQPQSIDTSGIFTSLPVGVATQQPQSVDTEGIFVAPPVGVEFEY